MRRDEFISKISEKTNIKKDDIELIMDTFQDILKSSLLSGESIIIDRFGVFESRIRPERIGEHPVNGNRVVIPPMREVVFRAAQDLKKELNP